MKNKIDCLKFFSWVNNWIELNESENSTPGQLFEHKPCYVLPACRIDFQWKRWIKLFYERYAEAYTYHYILWIFKTDEFVKSPVLNRKKGKIPNVANPNSMN